MSIDVLCPLVLSFWAKEGERGEGRRGRGGKGYIEGREGGERREGKIAKGTQWQKQRLTVQLFDAPMIKVSFVSRSPD